MLSSPAGVIRRGAAGVAILLAAGLAAACSSSGGTPNTSAPQSSSAPGSGQTTVSTAAPVTSTSAPPPVLTAADTKEIKKAYVSFFKSGTTATKSATLLQHGSMFIDSLKTQAKSPAAQGLSVTVSKVVSLQRSVAVATFTLLSAGKPVLANTTGYAVKEGGRWKVSAGTLCQLLKLQNAAPKQCDDATVTAFPNS
jgi:hypothetical protein